jgi:hypothetical protein
MIDSSLMLDCECGWTGAYDELADDGPGHQFCCPECGADLLDVLVPE